MISEFNVRPKVQAKYNSRYIRPEYIETKHFISYFGYHNTIISVTELTDEQTGENKKNICN